MLALGVPGQATLRAGSPRRPSGARPARLHVAAFAHGSSTADRARGPFPRGHPSDGTYERVLRYPNGTVRRIRYPLPPAPEMSEDVTDGCWGDSCWEPRAQWLGMAAAAGGGGGGGGAAVAAPPPAAPQQQPAMPPPAEAEPAERLPASPMELLRYLNSPEYRAAQEQLWQRVRGSYEVLDAVPWVAPRPLFLLATEQRGGAPSAAAAAAAAARYGGDASPGQTYTLRTRVARAEASDELSMVLKKRAQDGSALIRCSEMKDGVVAFESEADAERYGQQLEAEGSAEVGIARCDSHELFRTAQDCKAVVVLLRGGQPFLPAPHQLATSLRQEVGDGGDDGGAAAGAQPLFD